MARNTGPSAKTVREVRARDLEVCARCGGHCGPMTTQHRKARGMGGTKDPAINDHANLLTLGGSGTTGCHGWVEAHPTEAAADGFRVPSWADPAEWPVKTWRGW